MQSCLSCFCHYCSHLPLNLRHLLVIVSSFGPAVTTVSHHKDRCLPITTCASCSDNIFASTTMIVLPRSTHSWNSCSHRRLHQTRFLTFNMHFMVLNKLHELGLSNSTLPSLAWVTWLVIMILLYFFVTLTKALFYFSYMWMI